MFEDFDLWGYIPSFIAEGDPAPVWEQFSRHYPMMEFEGFTVGEKPNGTFKLSYPGDPDYSELSRLNVNDEIVVLFPHSWVMIVQADGSHKIARMD